MPSSRAVHHSPVREPKIPVEAPSLTRFVWQGFWTGVAIIAANLADPGGLEGLARRVHRRREAS